LRLRLYDSLNDFGYGFLNEAARAKVLDPLESELRLRPGDLERLLYLDAPEHAVLTRVGSEPEPEDVAAQYNLGVLVALLRHAETVELVLDEAAGRLEPRVRALGASHGVEVQVGSRGSGCVLEVRGCQDSLGSWARHGRRLSRLVLELLERSRPSVVDGHAVVALKGRRGRLRFRSEVLDVLSGVPAQCTGWDDLEGSRPGDVLTEAAQVLRAPFQFWGFRHQPEPQAWRSGVLLPDFLARAGCERFYLYSVRSVAHGTRLTSVVSHAAAGEPYVFIGEVGPLEPLREAEARTVPVQCFEKPAVVAALRSEFGQGGDKRQGGRAA
jgi:predicted nuclease of restriction endonuclease-like RecB superfamily